MTGSTTRIGLQTIVRREFGRIIRIWGQTLIPPGVTATLYFIVFGSLIGGRIGAVNGYTYTQFIAPGGPGMRLDTHLYPGYEIPPNYDSLIGKLIAHGPTRDLAIARMRRALGQLAIEGVETSSAHHLALLREPGCAAGGIDIHHLERLMADGFGRS